MMILISYMSVESILTGVKVFTSTSTIKVKTSAVL